MAFDLFAAPAPRKPRPHQTAALDRLRQSLAEKHRRPCLVLPTGAGKTFLASLIVRGALAKGNRVCFTVPALSLIDQTVEAFEAEGIGHIGVIQADHPRTDPLAPVQVASVQTLGRRSLPPAGVVIVDECHRKATPIARWMDERPEVTFIGLTATPGRAGMGREYDDLVVGATLRELTEAGILAPFRVFAPSHPDLSGVKVVAGDYHEGQLAEVMGSAGLVADVVTTWGLKGEGRPTLVFAVDRAHAKKLQAEFVSAGVPAGYVDAFTSDVERRVVADRFRRGELPVVCNVGCLTTGVDWDVRCIVLARPTKSEMLYVQMIGRGLRTAEGKDDCLILDHSDTTLRLGFVDDIEWTKLPAGSGEKSARRRDEPLPRDCSACGFVMAPKVHACPACGFTPERKPGVTTGEGELVELGGKAKAKPPTKADKQRWYSGLLHIAGTTGRRPGWAAHKYRTRFGCWPRGLSEQWKKPDIDVLAFVKAEQIRWAKSQGASRAA
jgi:DNA repair protein RadD